MSQFFVSCAMGFEDDLLAEMQTFWFEMMDLDGQPTRRILSEYEIKEGGIEVEAPDHLGFQINLFSKLANRVLLRIYKFEARYFDQFEKEFKKLDLAQWLEPQNLVLKIEAHKSRINNQKSIEESLTKLLKEKKFAVVRSSVMADDDDATSEAAQILYVRNDKDRVTISLDTSGAHLHKRGYSVHRGEAPLREVFAGSLFRQLLKLGVSLKDLTLVDPFVGSGTVLFESLTAKLPLLKRHYSWLRFRNRPKLFKSETWMHNFKWISGQADLSTYGFDIDTKSIGNLEKNQKILNEIFPTARAEVHAVVGDSLAVDLGALKNKTNLWLITNPPYGYRLSEGDAVKVLERFERELPLRGLIVLHPESWNLKFSKLRLVSKIDFRNQGLKLKLSVYSLDTLVSNFQILC